jgi:hypothetical protein
LLVFKANSIGLKSIKTEKALLNAIIDWNGKSETIYPMIAAEL